MIEPPGPESGNLLAKLWAYLPGAAVLAGAWIAASRFLSKPDRNAYELSRQQQDHERRIAAVEKEQTRLHSELMGEIREIRSMLFEVLWRERAHDEGGRLRAKHRDAGGEP